MELEATNQHLLKDLESEKDEYKKIVEEMKRVENELKIKNEEFLIAKEEAETELKKMEDKYNELVERFGAVEKEYSYLKSLYDAENLIGQGGNNVAYDNEVIVVDEYRNVNNIVTDAIVISDESDTEYDNPPRESNINPQLPVGIKQEEEWSNGANSSQVNHSSSQVNHPSSSSSSSSSDEYVLVPLPVKRYRDDYNKS